MPGRAGGPPGGNLLRLKLSGDHSNAPDFADQNSDYSWQRPLSARRPLQPWQTADSSLPGPPPPPPPPWQHGTCTAAAAGQRYVSPETAWQMQQHARVVATAAAPREPPPPLPASRQHPLVPPGLGLLEGEVFPLGRPLGDQQNTPATPNLGLRQADMELSTPQSCKAAAGSAAQHPPWAAGQAGSVQRQPAPAQRQTAHDSSPAYGRVSPAPSDQHDGHHPWHQQAPWHRSQATPSAQSIQSTDRPPLPLETPPPLYYHTPPLPPPLDTPPADSEEAPPPPPPPPTTPPPLPLDSGPAASGAAASSAGVDTGSWNGSPMVPDFIKQLWQQHQEPAAPPAQAGQPHSVVATHAAKLAAAPACTAAPVPASSSTLRPVEAAQAHQQQAGAQRGAGNDVEEGEVMADNSAKCAAPSKAAAVRQPPSSPTRPARSGCCSCSTAAADSKSEAASRSRADKKHRSSRGERRSCSRGRLSHRSSRRSRRERSFSSSSSSRSSRGSSADSSSAESEYASRHRRRADTRRRHRGVGGRRRQSRSPLRRVERSETVNKRRATAAAAPGDAREAQLTLASLVESMSAEAASLHRQLDRLAVSDAGADGAAEGATSSRRDGRNSTAGGGAKTADSAHAPAPSAASGATSTAEVERQLAALSSKLGQLSLCLESLHLQPRSSSVGAVAAVPAPVPQQASKEHEGATYLCFDTNVWMDHSKLIKECFKRIVDSGCSSVRILVPLAVMRELDGLKKCLFRGWWARKAIGRMAGMQGDAALRGQREDELHRGQLRRNDDGILDCLFYFRTSGAKVEFVTKDLQLLVRVRNEGFPCCSGEEARQRLIQRLQKETAAKHPPRYPAPPQRR